MEKWEKVSSPAKTHGDVLQKIPMALWFSGATDQNHFASPKIAAVIYTKYTRIYFTPTICPPSPLNSSELDSLAFYIYHPNLTPPPPKKILFPNLPTTLPLSHHPPTTTHQPPPQPPLRSATLEAPRSWRNARRWRNPQDGDQWWPVRNGEFLVAFFEVGDLFVLVANKNPEKKIPLVFFSTFAGWNLGWFGDFFFIIPIRAKMWGKVCSQSWVFTWWFQP